MRSGACAGPACVGTQGEEVCPAFRFKGLYGALSRQISPALIACGHDHLNDWCAPGPAPEAAPGAPPPLLCYGRSTGFDSYSISRPCSRRGRQRERRPAFLARVLPALSRKKLQWEPDSADGPAHAHDELHASMPKVLNWFDLMCFGIGGIIGAGVYILSGKVAAQTAGPSVVISFIFAGVFCIFSGLCAGSAYSYAYLSLGEFPAWIIGWDLVLEYTVGTAAIAKGWSYYFCDFIDALGANLPKWLQEGAAIGDAKYWNANLLAALLILALTGILCFGIKESAWFSNVIVCTKIVTLLIVVGAGMGLVRRENYEPFVPPEFGWMGAWNGAATVFFAYIGFDSVSVVAEEAKRPSRDIPLGIMGSLLICTVLYVVVVLTLVGMVKYSAIDTRAPLVAVFRAHGMKWAQLVVGVGAISGLTSTCLSTMMPQSRIFLAMARDGLLPPVFGKASAPPLLPPPLSSLFGPAPPPPPPPPLTPTHTPHTHPTPLPRPCSAPPHPAPPRPLRPAPPRPAPPRRPESPGRRGRQVNRRTGAPVHGTLIVGGLCAAIAGLVEMNILADAVSIGTLFAFSVVCTGILILRYQGPGREGGGVLGDALFLYAALLVFCFTAGNPDCPLALRVALGLLSGGASLWTTVRIWRKEQAPVPAKFVCPLVPLVPILGMLGNVYLMTRVGGEAWVRLVIWFLLGLLVYFGYAVQHSKLAAGPAPAPLRELPGVTPDGDEALSPPKAPAEAKDDDDDEAQGSGAPRAPLAAPGGAGRALPSPAAGAAGRGEAHAVPRAHGVERGSSGSGSSARSRGGDFELAHASSLHLRTAGPTPPSLVDVTQLDAAGHAHSASAAPGSPSGPAAGAASASASLALPAAGLAGAGAPQTHGAGQPQEYNPFLG
eukprot:tig00001525_g9239.t1